MLATVSSAVVHGVDGRSVSVEVHVSNGLPGYTLVGLPDASCRESRDRVRAAILSSGLKWPSKRITINLAPSGVRKQGSSLDLPIALGLLAASEQIPVDALKRFGAVGELGLDGSVRAVPGMICLAGAIDAPEIFVPIDGSEQAAVVRPGSVRAVESLLQLAVGLGEADVLPSVLRPQPATDDDAEPGSQDLADVRGQPLARWALEVAAAGGHHLLMIGPPGAGKTMLASRLPGLLPPLEPDRALSATRVHSAAGLPLPKGGLIHRPPFRAPHHGASMVAMVGGGTAAMRPGEISCAHGGVLFLDELGEFSVPILDALRQPLEQGVVRISRAARSVTLPAHFLLVAAMNPCPCGEGGSGGRCRCSDAARARYSRRLSGPLLDRFDLRVEVCPPAADILLGHGQEETTKAVACRIVAARARAATRGVRCNAELSSGALESCAPLSVEATQFLRYALESGELTGRGLRRVRTVARTIADLRDDGDVLSVDTVRAAFGLRATPRSVLGGA